MQDPVLYTVILMDFNFTITLLAGVNDERSFKGIKSSNKKIFWKKNFIKDPVLHTVILMNFNFTITLLAGVNDERNFKRIKSSNKKKNLVENNLNRLCGV